MKRYKVKYLKTIGKFVLHVRYNKVVIENMGTFKGGWRRLWGYTFATESMANKFARGNF